MNNGIDRRGFLKRASLFGAALCLNPIIEKINAATKAAHGDINKTWSGNARAAHMNGTRVLGKGNYAMFVSPLGKPLYKVASDYQPFRYFYFVLSNISSLFGFHNISSDCLSEKADISLKQKEYSYPIVAKLRKIFQNAKGLTDFNSHSHSYISRPEVSKEIRLDEKRHRGRLLLPSAAFDLLFFTITMECLFYGKSGMTA